MLGFRIAFRHVIGALFWSLRPKQWPKNLLVFAGLVFSLNLFNLTDLLRSLGGFVAFCLLSGSVYIVNDLADVEKDRLHPLKRLRPIASGRLQPGAARVAAVVAAIVALAGGFALDGAAQRLDEQRAAFEDAAHQDHIEGFGLERQLADDADGG